MKLSEEKMITKRYYDRSATDWVVKRSDANYCRAEFDEFCKLLPNNGRVVDLGCGTAREASRFVQAGYEYVGVDLSDGMLAEAKNRFPEGDFRQMDVCSLRFDNELFDGVWSFAAYLHLPKNEINYAIREANRVLKIGGIGFISIKKGNSEKYLGDGEGRRYWSFYKKNQFTKILTDNGFEIIRSWEDRRDYNPPEDISVFICYLFKKVTS